MQIRIKAKISKAKSELSDEHFIGRKAEKNVLYLSGFGGDSITILSDTGRDDGASIGTHALA